MDATAGYCSYCRVATYGDVAVAPRFVESLPAWTLPPPPPARAGALRFAEFGYFGMEL